MKGSLKRALVVDDSPLVLQATSTAVERLGFEVVNVDGPVAALASFAMYKFDLVVSDIQMPGEMNGIVLAQELRRKSPEIPILLTTGNLDCVADQECEFRILPKPFRLGELKAAIERITQLSLAMVTMTYVI